MENTKFIMPGFLANSNIYEVNIRQYTTEGTFAAFATHLPRLKHMGVQILWLMPIHPIGLKNRKGTLGSYYSVRDFNDVNAEYGTKEDFKKLVTQIHEMGMKIIIDWVANHAAWDNVWTSDNPAYFMRNEVGEFKNAFDWEDVIQINHDSEAQQNAMIAAMQNWIVTYNIDGFRADLAHLTPLQFWIKARTHLSTLKSNLIWLAETEEPNYHIAFDISYTWKWMHEVELFCKKEKSLQDCINVLKWQKENFPTNAQRMFFTSNHDENSWNGTEFEKYGKLAMNMAVLSCTYIGIPLLYSGQELPNKKRLPFFDKDFIEWQPINELHTFYKTLFDLRNRNSIYTNATLNDVRFYEEYIDENIIAFNIRLLKDGVIVLLNFSDQLKEVDAHFFNDSIFSKNIFTEEILSFPLKNKMQLQPYDFLVFECISK